MGLLLSRVKSILTKRGDLRAVEAAVRKRLWEGNKEAVLAGLTPDGEVVAPLRPYTIKHRRGVGPPRAPMGVHSRAIAGYVVQTLLAHDRITFTGSWPGFTPIIEYLDRGTIQRNGTRRMAARPTFGFRQKDLEYVRLLLRNHGFD